MKSILFDTATGRRIYRNIGERARSRLFRRAVFDWVLEILGVGLLAVGVGMAFLPGGFVIIGGYAVAVANSGD